MLELAAKCKTSSPDTDILLQTQIVYLMYHSGGANN